MTKTKNAQYIANVKKGIEIYEAMAALDNNQKILISYNGKEYAINCHIFEFLYKQQNERSYTISDNKIFGKSMNINMELSTKVSLQAYTYDLFNQVSVAKIYFENVKII